MGLHFCQRDPLGCQQDERCWNSFGDVSIFVSPPIKACKLTLRCIDNGMTLTVRHDIRIKSNTLEHKLTSLGPVPSSSRITNNPLMSSFPERPVLVGRDEE